MSNGKDNHLTCDEEDFYTLNEGKEYVWVRVGPIDIYIKRNDDNVSVDLYASFMRELDLSPDICNLGHVHAAFEDAEFVHEEAIESLDHQAIDG